MTPDEVVLDQRKRAIVPEIMKLGSAHPWAGVYERWSIDTGWRLYAAPHEGYLLTSIGAWGNEDLLERGRVRCFGGRLLLTPKFALNGTLFSPDRLCLVASGDRRFLMPEDHVASFRAELESDPEHVRLASTWRRASSEGVVLASLRESSKHREQGPEGPRIARVVRKLDKESLDSFGHLQPCVELDVGRDQGIELGTEFVTSVPATRPPVAWSAVVVSVGDKTCEVRCPYPQYFDELAIGAELSTREEFR